MTKKELIESLKDFSEGVEICIYDPSNKPVPVESVKSEVWPDNSMFVLLD